MNAAHRPVVLGLTLASSLLGAVAATWFWSVPLDRRLLLVVGAAAFGAGMAWWCTAWPVARAGSSDAVPCLDDAIEGARPPGQGAAPAEWWARATSAPGPANATSSRATGAPPRGGAVGSVPSPDPAPASVPVAMVSTTASAQIAQCPRCGDFRLAVHRDQDSYSFRCTVGCGHVWAWIPGSPWPPVAVHRTANNQRSLNIEHRKADF